MKIIGHNSKEEKYIVEIDAKELARFTGFYSMYCLKEKVQIQCGTVIDVGECYEKAREALKLHEEAIGAAKTLKSTASKFLGFFD